jgi:hypothetical protein
MRLFWVPEHANREGFGWILKTLDRVVRRLGRHFKTLTDRLDALVMMRVNNGAIRYEVRDLAAKNLDGMIRPVSELDPMHVAFNDIVQVLLERSAVRNVE